MSKVTARIRLRQKLSKDERDCIFHIWFFVITILTGRDVHCTSGWNASSVPVMRIPLILNEVCTVSRFVVRQPLDIAVSWLSARVSEQYSLLSSAVRATRAFA